jgi:cytochrome b561
MNNNLSKPTIILHWLVGLSFLGALCVGSLLDFFPKGPDKMLLLGLHKSFGTMILLMAMLRLIWRLKEGSISSLYTVSKVQAMGVKFIQYFLLLVTITMPISGIVMSIGGGYGLAVFGLELVAAGDKIEWLGSFGHDVHTMSVNFIIVALVLHIAGALKHQYIDKDGTLSRMLGNRHR